MAVTIGKIASKRQSAVIDFDGEELHVEFYPQRISPKMLASFTELDQPLVSADGGAPSSEQVMERINLAVEILVRLLADWDMVEDITEDGVAGPKLPIDTDHLSELGLPILWAIVGGVLSASQMGK